MRMLPNNRSQWKIMNFYVVRAGTRNRIQNIVKVQLREGIWDGQTLFGKQGPSLSVPRPLVPDFDPRRCCESCSSGQFLRKY
ncbi:hypothetical protein ARMGADRAFT_88312 [Armillaria gallica]|uniref:Uncharacterized protein n=1 Tax=Armillaria gallica TaxID=47427 RepID=A0A2H3DYM7_ARMGA|nr:hypothetical protein ARMGADRAFT_88312 [Armillaria gallica]